MNALQRYFNYRQALIDQYVKGDMTKREYLDRNLDAVLSLNIKPFRNIDTVDKALFNYQYYNALAKEAAIESRLCEKGDYNISNEQTNYYYMKKDYATSKVLELMDYTGIEAYLIKVRSKELKNKLFEIILKDRDMVLHSSSPAIMNRLIAENVFSDGVKRSVIDGYINHRY
jgi:hypothetical protein